MSSAHPDFVHVDGKALSDAQLVELFQNEPPEAVKTLNGRLLAMDSVHGTSHFRFEVVPAFCHSQGKICQGGFLTGMVDTAMAHAAIAKGRLAVAVPTLELKISFLEPMGPGVVLAEGRVLRWGGTVGFLEGDLHDVKGRHIVHATSTVKIVRPKAR